MLNKLKTQREGFTIIEVIIVLVIGAVIMLAVFLVVPQLQRSQRNTRRQADARKLLSAAEQFAANNNGYYPTQSPVPSGISNSCSGTLNAQSCKSIIDISGEVKTPSNTEYTINSTENAKNINITYNSQTCTNNKPVSTANSGKMVITINLETQATNAGSGDPAQAWCVSS